MCWKSLLNYVKSVWIKKKKSDKNTNINEDHENYEVWWEDCSACEYDLFINQSYEIYQEPTSPSGLENDAPLAYSNLLLQESVINQRIDGVPNMKTSTIYKSQHDLYDEL